ERLSPFLFATNLSRGHARGGVRLDHPVPRTQSTPVFQRNPARVRRVDAVVFTEGHRDGYDSYAVCGHYLVRLRDAVAVAVEPHADTFHFRAGKNAVIVIVQRAQRVVARAPENLKRIAAEHLPRGFESAALVWVPNEKPELGLDPRPSLARPIAAKIEVDRFVGHEKIGEVRFLKRKRHGRK